LNWLLIAILGVVLLIVAYYLGLANAPPNPAGLRWFLGLLGAICLVVGLILFVLFLAGASPRLGFLALWPLLLLGAISPTPVHEPIVPSTAGDGGYLWKYVANAVLICGSFVSALGTFLTINPEVNAGWLGLTDVQWHWALLVIGVVTIAYNGATHAPPLTAPPTRARLALEARVHELRSNWIK
jgi:hypothetical protein